MYKKLSNFLIKTALVALVVIFSLVLIIESTVVKRFKGKFGKIKSDQIEYFLDTSMDDLDSMLFSNAIWTDTLIALEAGQYEWLYDNATGYLVDDEHFNVDYLFISNESGSSKEVYGETIDFKDEFSNLYSSIVYENRKIRKIELVDGRPLMLVGSPIYDNENRYPNGIYVIGRFIDEDEVDALSKLLTENYTLSIDFSVESKELSHAKNHLSISRDLKYSDGLFLNAVFDISYFLSMYEVSYIIIMFAMIIIAVVSVFLLSSSIKKLSKVLVNITYDVSKISKGDYKKKIRNNKKYGFEEVDLLEQSIIKMVSDIGTHLDTVTRHSDTIDKQYMEMIDLIVNVVELNDRYTYHHSYAVSKYAELLGRRIGFEKIDDLILASKLHDVGKISIPLSILNKPGALTKEEFDVVKTHPSKGHSLLDEVDIFKEAKEGVLYHHEMYNGEGYPFGLKGDDIPLMAQIISVVDMYDALTSGRAYREELSHEVAIEMLRAEKGKSFAPNLVDEFISILEDPSIETNSIKEYSNQQVDFIR